MTQPDLALVAVLVACATASCSNSSPFATGDAGSALPGQSNIILVMTDDQTVADLRAMPLTRQSLGGHGVVFSNAFVSWPLCCPSRATAFTGQYAHNHNVLGNYPPDGSSQAFTTDDEALPVWLGRAGYTTVHVGKYLNGYGHDNRGETYIPPGWDSWQALVDPTTYRMWGYTMNRDGELATYGQFENEDPALYQTDVLAQAAIDALDRLSVDARPFFMSVAFLAPHEEFAENAQNDRREGPRPAPRHAGSFADTPLPQPPNFDEEDLSDKPPVVEDYATFRGEETMEQRTLRYQRRLESLAAVDDAVQAIVDKLAALRKLDSTYIVFTSDNGFFNGEHHIPFGKYLMYEPSIRVPLLIRGPTIPAGLTSDELVVNVDLAATFLELAGATAGRIVDGRSLLAYARDPNLRSQRPILLDAPHDQVLQANVDGSTNRVTIPPLRGLRTTRHAYVEYGSGEVELYDLGVDPFQLQSRHDDPAYQAARAELHAALLRFQDCEGDACRADLELE